MDREKIYSILNRIKSYLWVFATIFGLIGTYTYRNYLLHITAYILFILGVSQIAMYLYFRKSADIKGLSEKSRFAASMVFILSAAQFYGGYYILINFP
jgi:hypothetical protein